MIETDLTIGTEEDSNSDGVEIEQEDSETIKDPFDPEKIKVRSSNVVVNQIISRIDHEEIDLAPGFQRRAGIWNDRSKSRLIESLLLRIPIPVFYVAANENENWSVVDGIQRISTIHDYVKGEFKLTQLEYLKFDGYTYQELPRSMQRRIDETQLVVNVIEPGTPKEVMFNIFRRINTGGLPLKGQEIRHALHPGPVRDFLFKLAGTDEFLTATGGSIKADRMADRECVIRFLAFHIDPWENYSSNDLDGYLGLAMRKINKMSPNRRKRLFKDFTKAMNTAHGIFRDAAFRKCYQQSDNRKRPINKALFEAWGVGLARCSDAERKKLVEKRQMVFRKFKSLMSKDLDFEAAISTSTGSPTRVRKRFQTIDNLIEQCL